MSALRLCTRCRFVKSENDFYKSRLTVCKDCVKAQVTAHRSANIERVRAYDRARGHHNKPGYSLEYRTRYPQRRTAQVALNNALRDGRIEPWPVCALPECNGSPEAHHPDYSAPLAVVWLCSPHHKQTHAMARKAA